MNSMNEIKQIVYVQLINDADSMKTVKFAMPCAKWNKELNWIETGL